MSGCLLGGGVVVGVVGVVGGFGVVWLLVVGIGIEVVELGMGLFRGFLLEILGGLGIV